MLIDSSEEEICHEICSIINNCATQSYLKLLLMILNLSAWMRNVLLVHTTKKGFEWNGQAVKELAEAGSIYICLKRSSSISNNSINLVELPQYCITTLVNKPPKQCRLGSWSTLFWDHFFSLFIWTIYHLVLPSVELYYLLMTPRFTIQFITLKTFQPFKTI